MTESDDVEMQTSEHAIDIETAEMTPLRGTLSRQDKAQKLLALPGMYMMAHTINYDGKLHVCEVDEALKGRLADGAAYWIDIHTDDSDTDELRAWLKKLQLSPFLTARLAEPSHTWTSQMLALKSASLIVIRILPEDEQSHTAYPWYLAALSTTGLFLTFTSCPVSTSSRKLSAEALHSMKVRGFRGFTNGALCRWLQFHIGRTAEAVRKIRQRVLEMEEKMDRHPSDVGIQELVDLKDELLRALSVAEEQTECIQSLSEAEEETDAVDFSNLRGTTGVLFATVGSNERLALRLEKRVGGLRQTYDSLQQDRINHRLAVLTVLSAIFLPLTLMAGIYGMNFVNIPELNNQNGYFILLGAMAAVAASMLFFFWRCGWFR